MRSRLQPARLTSCSPPSFTGKAHFHGRAPPVVSFWRRPPKLWIAVRPAGWRRPSFNACSIGCPIRIAPLQALKDLQRVEDPDAYVLETFPAKAKEQSLPKDRPKNGC